MSRIGRAPITVPSGVQVQIEDHHVKVKGPLGELSRDIHPDIKVELQADQILVTRPDDSVDHRSLHGVTRSIIANMVTGVTQGFEKTLELSGVGYRVAGNKTRLSLQLGFSHPIEITPPEGIEIARIESFTPTQTNEWLSGRITVRGIDKEVVGEVAAKIRKIREVEPYKGKGLRYRGERIRRKAGKAAGKGK